MKQAYYIQLISGRVLKVSGSKELTVAWLKNSFCDNVSEVRHRRRYKRRKSLGTSKKISCKICLYYDI